MSKRALKRVERFQGRGNIRGLCRLARHRDPLVRRRAIKALGALAEPTAVTCIDKALQEEADQWAKQWGIEALAKMGTTSALEALTGYMFHVDKTFSQLAVQSLRNHPSAQAQMALRVYEALTRNAFDALKKLGPEATHTLEIATQSSLFQSWPAAKRRKVLDMAVQRDIKPSVVGRQELADLGVFVGGMHSINDLIDGLKSRNALTRQAAAKHLGQSGQAWARVPLYRRFSEEVKSSSEAGPVELAMARALGQLGDNRALETYKDHLHGQDDSQASRAARALSKMDTPAALDVLFQFAADPPSDVAYRQPMAFNAIEAVGPAALEHLAAYMVHENPTMRRLMASVISYSQHEDTLNLLAQLALDDHAEVQRTAIEALAAINTEEAATKLYVLLDEGPYARIIHALASITHPAGPDYVKRAMPDATIIVGTIFDEEGNPLEGAKVQIVHPDDTGPAGWRALTGRASTDVAGSFIVASLDDISEAEPHIKLTKPNNADAIYHASLNLIPGRRHKVEVRINRFFEQLQTWVDVIPE